MSNPSNNYKPFMAYITQADHNRLRKLSDRTGVPMAQLVREGISFRLSTGNPHVAGFNDGMKKAVEIVRGLTASEMRFPSGKSFGELVAEAVLDQIIVEDKDENSQGPA